MLALIDADIIAYSVGFASDSGAIKNGEEHEPVEFALHSTRKLVESIVEGSMCSKALLFLTGRKPDGTVSMREELYDQYKKNRDPSHKPHWHKEIREYIMKKYDVVLVDDGLEADDWLTIFHSKDPLGTVLCSLDKDMLQAAGFHYNWRKGESTAVTPQQGDYNLAMQMLTGDAADNIPGIFNLFGKKATKKVKESLPLPDDDYLDDDWYKRALFQTVLDIYQGEWETFITNGTLLFLPRKEGQTFQEYIDLKSP